MNKQTLILLCLLSLTYGCSTLKQTAYQKIDYSNGINRFEAIDLANEKMKKDFWGDYFKLVKPILRDDKYAAKFPDYWFVDYTPDVYTDFSSFLVVINKTTGEVVRAKDYYWPDKKPELDWVFN